MIEEQHHTATSLWLFIGAILMIYGVIIFATGIVHFMKHMPLTTTLESIHPDIIWGVVLFVAGSLFVFFNRKHIGKNSK
jgi:predicted metal-binding membrane protein